MSIVDEIKARLDIVDVIGSYIPLKRSGKNYKALCPFHEEKTPSFVVFPETQTWHCFGACGTGGDVFSFVMKKEGVDFLGALRLLAERAGIPWTEEKEGDAQSQLRERLREIHAAATAHFQELLHHHPEGEVARAYLQQRGLSQETVTAFQLGYARDAWDDLLQYLRSLGYQEEELEKAGLIIVRDEGRMYDRFRHRLMIPIHDAQGRVIAFAGRVLGEGHPKYLNSPQTPIFDKGRTLYGYAQAVRAIREKGEAIIVEGYMDVLSAHQAGFRNVVASMGTALTPTQLRLLSRHTRRIILALDADVAGQQAALRGIEVARENLERDVQPMITPTGALRFEATLNVDLRILRLPEGMDPDDLIRQDPSQWEKLVREALPVVEFYLQYIQETLDLSTAEGKAEAIRIMKPLLREVASAVMRDHYIQQLARLLRVDERVLAADILDEPRPRRRRARPKESPPSPAPQPTPPLNTVQEMERHFILLLLRAPDTIRTLDEELELLGLEEFRWEELEDTRHRIIIQVLLTSLIGGNLTSAEDILSQIPDEMLEYARSLVEEAKSLPDTPEHLMPHKILTALIWLRLLRHKEAARQIRFLIEEAQEADEHTLITYSIRLGNHLRAIRELERLLPALTLTR
ncbi:MAG: DNA primase [Chloroflexi bacterium]|nr:DNA primase [Chloroflexota bacterium]